MKPTTLHRSARSGKFVTAKKARKSPGTTVREKVKKRPVKWVDKKTWDEFRGAGLLWFINTILHVFGWAIVVEVDDKTKLVTGCYPARVKFRGFDDKSQTEEHIKLADYLSKTSPELKKEARL